MPPAAKEKVVRKPEVIQQLSDREFKRIVKSLPGIKLVHDGHAHLVNERTGNKILTFNKHPGGNPVLYWSEIVDKLTRLGVSVDEFIANT